MSAPNPDLEKLQKELGFYKGQVQELSGENLKMDYALTGLRHEIKQKRQGFALLSTLQRAIASVTELSEIFRVTLLQLNSTIGMDRTVLLLPAADTNKFEVHLTAGFSEDISHIKEFEFPFPEEIRSGQNVLIVNGASPETDLITAVRKTFNMPFFLIGGIEAEKELVAILITARMLEKRPLYPPLDSGDADTVNAICGLISAFTQNIKVRSLKEMDRMKTEFFANISHEFRTPITLTLGPLEELLAGRYGEIPQAAIAEVTQMIRSQNRLLGLINQILDLAKLEAGATIIKACEIQSMNDFLNMRIDQIRGAAVKRGLEVKTELSEPVGAKVFLDIEKMEKAVFNLLSNALKFTQKGSITIQSGMAGDKYFVRVVDTGMGIRADQLHYIFDRFKQADGSSTREFAGTGIGLSLVKEVIELHGGKVEVSSTYGKGTAFELLLPIGRIHLPDESVIQVGQVEATGGSIQQVEMNDGKVSDEELEAVAAHNAHTDANKLHKWTILYTDDNRALREFVAGVLKDRFNVYLAVNGQRGLELARIKKIDLILSDMMMPVMNGSEFLQNAKADLNLKSLPFVILTSMTSRESKIQGLEHGADDYLHKPFSAGELIARVSNLISRREYEVMLQRELRAARAIQQSLMPAKQMSCTAGIFEYFYRPCEQLSGDFVDAFLAGDYFYYYVADVTSHGTAAAQVTYLVKSIFQSVIQTMSPGEGLESIAYRVGKAYSALKLDYGVGLQVYRIHNVTQTLETVSSNAPESFLVRDGKLILLSHASGDAIDGTLWKDSAQFPSLNFQLQQGDKLYSFTDGAYEFNTDKGRQYGLRKLSNLFVDKCSTDGWQTEIEEELESARGPGEFPDDITVTRMLISEIK